MAKTGEMKINSLLIKKLNTFLTHLGIISLLPFIVTVIIFNFYPQIGIKFVFRDLFFYSVFSICMIFSALLLLIPYDFSFCLFLIFSIIFRSLFFIFIFKIDNKIKGIIIEIIFVVINIFFGLFLYIIGNIG
jgi:hypothetical protein